MMNSFCDKYIDNLEIGCDEIGLELYKVIECDYCRRKEKIEKRLNKVPGYIGDIWLSDFVWFYYAKKELEEWWRKKFEDIDLLPEILELIWKLLLDKKIKTEKFEFIDRWDKWDINVEWWLNPCEFDDDNVLKEEIARWQKNILESYKTIFEKYGSNSADILADIIPIVKSDCYEWEIKIE